MRSERIGLVNKGKKNYGSFQNEMDELNLGIKTEREHKDVIDEIRKRVKDGKLDMTDDEFFTLIAKDHLKEMSDYYSKLKKMEG